MLKCIVYLCERGRKRYNLRVNEAVFLLYTFTLTLLPQQ